MHSVQPFSAAFSLLPGADAAEGVGNWVVDGVAPLDGSVPAAAASLKVAF